MPFVLRFTKTCRRALRSNLGNTKCTSNPTDSLPNPPKDGTSNPLPNLAKTDTCINIFYTCIVYDANNCNDSVSSRFGP